MDHLRLHCTIAYELWSMVFCLFGIHWVMPYKVSELLASWQGKFGRHRNIDLWTLVPHCLFWCLWREQNSKALRIVNGLFLTLSIFFSVLSLIGAIIRIWRDALECKGFQLSGRTRKHITWIVCLVKVEKGWSYKTWWSRDAKEQQLLISWINNSCG